MLGCTSVRNKKKKKLNSDVKVIVQKAYLNNHAVKGYLISLYFSEEVMVWSVVLHKTLLDKLIICVKGDKTNVRMEGFLAAWCP